MTHSSHISEYLYPSKVLSKIEKGIYPRMFTVTLLIVIEKILIIYPRMKDLLNIAIVYHGILCSSKNNLNAHTTVLRDFRNISNMSTLKLDLQ